MAAAVIFAAMCGYGGFIGLVAVAYLGTAGKGDEAGKGDGAND